MLARPNFRLLGLLSVGFIIFVFLLIVQSSERSFKHLKPSITDVHVPHIFEGTAHGAAKAPQEIRDFWKHWAKTFNASAPQVPKIEVKDNNKASTAGSNQADGERKPCPHSLDLPKETVDSLHASHKLLLQDRGLFKVRFGNQSKELFSGTGIVTVAGGAYFAPAILSIRMLRQTGSKLPIHVFLEKKSEYEPDVCEDILPSLNAKCFILTDFLPKNSISVTHFQLKALAILFSPFETVLYIDSDCFPVRDPSEILTTEPFTSTGLVTWPDYWIATEDPVFYTIAGMPSFPTNLPARSTESGEILISKNIHLSSLLLAAYYNLYGPGYYYPLFSQGALGEGDKETFLAAAVVLGLPHYRVKQRVGTLGFFTAEGEFKGGAMVQHHPREDYLTSDASNTTLTSADVNNDMRIPPFFIHANYPKLNVAYLLDGNALTTPSGKAIRLWGKKEDVTKKFEGRDMERECWDQMRKMACEMEGRLWDWRGKKRLCKRAQEHWQSVFGGGAFLSGIM